LFVQVDRTELKLSEHDIVWPGKLRRKPDGIRTRRNVSIVTIPEKPFIFTRPGDDCKKKDLEVFCPRRKLNGKNNLSIYTFSY